MSERLVSADEARALLDGLQWVPDFDVVRDLAATVEALHAEVAALRAQVAEARDAERDAVVAYMLRASWGQSVDRLAQSIASDAHRVRT